jgi:hypothetical protein
MFRGLMFVELERYMRLALPAAEYLLIELVLFGDVSGMPRSQFRPLLEGRARLDFTFVTVLPVQSSTDWALHKSVYLSIILADFGKSP